MRRLKLTGAALLGCALIALAPASALATKAPSSKSAVLSDCEAHGRLTRHYSVAQLQQALNSMPSTIAEYGNCSQIIQDQIDSQESKPLKGGGAGASNNSGSGSSSALLILVVVVVVVVIVAGGGFLYSRRRAGGGDSEDPPPPRAA